MANNSSTPGSVPGAKPVEGEAGKATPTSETSVASGNLPGVPTKTAEQVTEEATKPVDPVPAGATPAVLDVLVEQRRLTEATAVENRPEFESIRVQPQEIPVGAQGYTRPEDEKGGKKYQFPSAPTRFEFASTKRVAIIPDGILSVTNEDEIKELEAAVAVGNIYPYTGDIISPFQKPPKPLDPNGLN